MTYSSHSSCHSRFVGDFNLTDVWNFSFPKEIVTKQSLVPVKQRFKMIKMFTFTVKLGSYHFCLCSGVLLPGTLSTKHSKVSKTFLIFKKKATHTCYLDMSGAPHSLRSECTKVPSALLMRAAREKQKIKFRDDYTQPAVRVKVGYSPVKQTKNPKKIIRLRRSGS